jgi:PAS domain S-box-containing protein
MKESDEKYRKLIETTQTGYVILDGHGKVLDANDEYARMTGHPAADAVIGKSVMEWTAGYDRDKNTASVEYCFKEGLIRGLEIDYIHPDGKIIPVEINATVVGSGSDIQILTLCRDISQRRRDESLLKMQRDLGLELSRITDLQEALMTIMTAALRIEGIDGGGIYLVDPITGEINLACSMGLPREYINTVLHYGKESVNTRIVMAGRPIYMAYDKPELNSMGIFRNETNLPEGLQSVAIIPVMHMAVTTACINVISRTSRNLPENSRNALESLGSIIGSTIDRLQAQEGIRASLREKEVLLKEIHHRVKNNLQIISSLLSLQTNKINDPLLLGHFNDFNNRIRAIALIHEKLYQSGDFSRIDFLQYIESIVYDTSQGLTISVSMPLFKITGDNVTLSLNQAIPCGLITNEIITNSLKYAFPTGWEGEAMIEISMFQRGSKQVELAISDNGIGFIGGIDAEERDSFGLTMICMLTKQINGTLQLDGKKGTRYVISFDSE